MTQPDDKFKIMLGAPILSGFAELMIVIGVILHQRVFVPVEIKLHTIKEHIYFGQGCFAISFSLSSAPRPGFFGRLR